MFLYPSLPTAGLKGTPTLIISCGFKAATFLLFAVGFLPSLNSQTPFSDCGGAIPACGNGDLMVIPTDRGTDDFNRFTKPFNHEPDCGFSESKSSWLTFKIKTAGTLGFVIIPENNDCPNGFLCDDYDFALYGPNVRCDSLGFSIRCQSTNPRSAGVGGETGIRESEPAGSFSGGPAWRGNGFVRWLDQVNVGETYFLLIDNFNERASYRITWQGTALLEDEISKEEGGIDLGPDLLICDNDRVILDGGFTSGDLYTWRELGSNTILGTEEELEVVSGTYTLEISTETGCLTRDTISVRAIDLNLDPQLVQPISCFNEDDGAITVLVNNGDLPYEYLWSTQDTSPNVDSLASGNYMVTVSEAGGCVAVESILVEDPSELSLSFDPTPGISCFGESDGEGEVVPSEATPPYSVLWNTNETTPRITNLDAGQYPVTVTDANDCQVISVLTITEPDLLEVSLDITRPLSCDGINDGEITATRLGGSAPFDYNWAKENMDGTVTELTGAMRTINNLSAGKYNVTVTDDHDCMATSTITVSEITPLIIGASVSQNIGCFAGDNGEISTTAQGGTPTYLYLWRYDDLNGNSSMLPSSNDMVSNAKAGTYFLTVSDMNNCQKTTSVTMSEPEEILVQVDPIMNLCFGEKNGVITSSVFGGTKPYLYAWGKENNNGIVEPLIPNTTSIENLSSGTYYLTVSDDKNCQKETSIQITQPDSLSLIFTNTTELKCFGDSGRIDVIVNGGTMPYTYLWNTGEMTASLLKIPAGIYSVTVQDGQQCKIELSTELEAMESLDVDFSDVKNARCHSANNGQATVEVIGGSEPYTFLWDNGETTAQAVQLLSGQNTVLIEDINGCAITTHLNIDVDLIPQVLIDESSEIDLEYGSDKQLNVFTNVDLFNINWSHPDVLSCVDCLDPIITPELIETYLSIEISDSVGCSARDSLLVRLFIDKNIYIPNAFSPNNDGVNDIFTIYTKSARQSRVESLKVFNRWGDLLYSRQNFQLDGEQVGWDGTFNDKLVDPGGYIYSVDVLFPDGSKEQKAGVINIIR